MKLATKRPAIRALVYLLALGPLACGGSSTGPTPVVVATQLAFTAQPSNVAAGAAISPTIQVTARDASGNAPTAVSGGISFAAVSPGGNYACGRTSAGAAYCWGLNNYGQLGDGSNTNRPTPVAVLQ